MKKKVFLPMVVLLVGVSQFAAASITVVDLPATGTDAAIGISTSKTYTHLVDFHQDPGTTINGVTFDPGAVSGTNYTIGGSLGSHAAGHDQADGGTYGLLDDFYFHFAAQAGESIDINLSGLTAGTTYSTRIYFRKWDDPDRLITIQGDGDSDGVFDDALDVNWDAGGAHYVDYTFTSDDGDVTVQCVANVTDQGIHLYGFSNEVVPEPATLAMLGLGALTLLKRRRV